MSPGGPKEAYDAVKPYLEKWAAKTPQGEPCVEYIGPGGSGHYVKMIHNGIEHGHLSIICEARALLHSQLGLSNEEIADMFEQWTRKGPLRGSFLLGIGYKGLRRKEGDGVKDKRGIVEGIEDKVTQDVDKSEGTGTWSTKVSCGSTPLRPPRLCPVDEQGSRSRRSPSDTSPPRLLRPLTSSASSRPTSVSGSQ
jgi:6-phosphogluconate dehydrogenase